jgi:hypothetical protein
MKNGDDEKQDFLEEQMGSDHTHSYFPQKKLIFNHRISERKNGQKRLFTHVGVLFP